MQPAWVDLQTQWDYGHITWYPAHHQIHEEKDIEEVKSQLKTVTTEQNSKISKVSDEISILREEVKDVISVNHKLEAKNYPRKGQRYTVLLDGGLIKGWGSKDSWLLIVCHD